MPYGRARSGPLPNARQGPWGLATKAVRARDSKLEESPGGTMTERSYNVIPTERGVPIKAWTRGVPIEPEAERQLRNVASLPFIHKWVAVMPDVHWGVGATIGSVIPTRG